MTRIIKSGSKGNCVSYFDNQILVDIGVAFKLIKDIIQDVKVIFLTHRHNDHIKISTLKNALKKNPNITVVAGDWMTEILGDIPAQYFELNKKYIIDDITFVPIKLYHDVPNCGYRFMKDDFKIFHATDTKHLEGITAENYNVYAIEHNYCEEKAEEEYKDAKMNNRFTRIVSSMNTHLSKQQAEEFIRKNAKPDSQIIRLHISESFG